MNALNVIEMYLGIPRETDSSQVPFGSSLHGKIQMFRKFPTLEGCANSLMSAMLICIIPKNRNICPKATKPPNAICKQTRLSNSIATPSLFYK